MMHCVSCGADFKRSIIYRSNNGGEARACPECGKTHVVQKDRFFLATLEIKDGEHEYLVWHLVRAPTLKEFHRKVRRYLREFFLGFDTYRVIEMDGYVEVMSFEDLASKPAFSF